MEFGYPTESGFVPPDAVSAKKWYLRSAESGSTITEECARMERVAVEMLKKP